jgi:hypothetical protein
MRARGRPSSLHHSSGTAARPAHARAHTHTHTTHARPTRAPRRENCVDAHEGELACYRDDPAAKAIFKNDEQSGDDCDDAAAAGEHKWFYAPHGIRKIDERPQCEQHPDMDRSPRRRRRGRLLEALSRCVRASSSSGERLVTVLLVVDSHVDHNGAHRVCDGSATRTVM